VNINTLKGKADAGKLPWLQNFLLRLKELAGEKGAPATCAVVLTALPERSWLAELTRVGWVKEAPVSIVFCLDFFLLKQACPNDLTFHLDDLLSFVRGISLTAQMAQEAACAAANLGLRHALLHQVLGEAQAVRAHLKLPPYVFPVVVLVIGGEEIPEMKKNSLRVFMEHYEEPSAQEIAEATIWWQEKEAASSTAWPTAGASRIASRGLQTALLEAGFNFWTAATLPEPEQSFWRREALVSLRQILRRGPRKPPLLARPALCLNLARLALLAGRVEQAEKLAQEALKTEPTAPDVLASLAVIHQYKGDLDKAAWFMDQALAQAPERGYLLFFRGQIYRRQGLKEQAKLCFRRAVEKEPTLKSAWLALAQTWEEDGQFDKAEVVYKEAYQAVGPDVTLLNNRGLCLSNLGRYAEAKLVFQEALRKKPRDPVVLANLALLLGQQGEFLPALNYYNQALRLRPHDPDLLNNKGFCLGKLGRFEEALRCYELALKNENGDLNLLHNKASCLTRLGRYKEALECYDLVLRLNPTDSSTLNNRGLCLMALGRLREALECFQLGLKLEPNNHILWGNKGACLFKQGKYTEALAAYERALAIAPDELAYYSGKGMCLDYLGRAEEAVDCYNRALRLA